LVSFFALQQEPNTPCSIIGHILRLVFYYHLFKGVFVNAIIYPYEKLEEVLTHLPLAVVTYDHNNCLTLANKKAEEITGLELTQVKGLNQTQIIKKMFTQRVPEQLMNELRIHREARQRIVTIQNSQAELVKIVADVYPLNSGGFLCIFDNANKMQEIQDLRLQTQTILNSQNNSVVVLDINQNIVMCNKAFCELVELSLGEIIGHRASELTDKLGIDYPCLGQNEIGSSAVDNIYQNTITTPSGKSKDILLQYGLIKNLDDEVIGSIGVGSDITNLKREQYESQQQEKLALLGQMATGIVHEIRNPITAILGFIQIV